MTAKKPKPAHSKPKRTQYNVEWKEYPRIPVKSFSDLFTPKPKPRTQTRYALSWVTSSGALRTADVTRENAVQEAVAAVFAGATCVCIQKFKVTIE